MKEKVLRCPNANDSCTYPDCPHDLQPVKETPMVNLNFSRSSKGDPIDVIKDIVSKLTYSEMKDFCSAIKADPQVVSDWADGTAVLLKNINTPSTTPQVLG